MYKKLIALGMLLLILRFSSSANTTMHLGILRVELNKFKEGFALKLYNTDGSLFVRVYKDEEDGEYKVQASNKQVNSMLLKDIRACYLDYGLMIFDTDGVKAEKFSVYIGSQIKYIKVNEIKEPLISYQSWQEFFKTVFIKTNSASFICTDTLTLKKILNAEKYSYGIKRVIGDWAYVECLKTCEQCPEGNTIKGWVRWRKKNKLLVDLFYFC